MGNNVNIIKVSANQKMCKNCVRQPFPDRDRMCLESGAFMANMKNCSSCNKNNLKTETVPRETVEDDMRDDDDDLEAENVTYNHVCAECNHIISRHKYKFW